MSESTMESSPEPSDGALADFELRRSFRDWGLRAAGRWHSQGRRIVYLADHSSSALLEMLVHMDRDLMPATYQLLRIVVPADIAVETIDAELSQDWRSQTLTSREIGDRWLDRSASALLRRQSARKEIITF
ncbi:RES domain-containing protein [Bradyrhizobium algeriense]|uniref:RES domain-containing protein n=1 Tax=Bradyrhizobium algeriense TaxID=634784 RepID=A0ABU8BIA4_9BRAD